MAPAASRHFDSAASGAVDLSGLLAFATALSALFA